MSDIGSDKAKTLYIWSAEVATYGITAKALGLADVAKECLTLGTILLEAGDAMKKFRAMLEAERDRLDGRRDE